MNLRDYIISPDFKIGYDIDGDTHVKDEKLSFKVKWQLAKYIIRKSLYWLQWAILIGLLVLLSPVELPKVPILVGIIVLAILPTTIRTIYVIKHSYILREKIYLRNTERYIPLNGKFLVENHYCDVEFNKILPDGTVSEHTVKASKEIYEKRNCIETARVTVFVYNYQPYFMVDDALKG